MDQLVSMAKRSEWIHAPEHFTPGEIPLAGRMVSMVMSLITLSVLAVCLIRRIQNVKSWRKLPITLWLVIVIYVDSYLFVFITAIFKDYGINASFDICQAAILLCLACYLTTKILIYVFLVEKAYIIRGSTKPRFQDPLYLFNCFGMMLPYCIVAIINFVWRISYIREDGVCIIGMERKALLPLIVFDVIVNVYLTALFLLPLRSLYSFKEREGGSNTLRRMAFRTFIGACATLVSSIVNLTVLTALHGEPGWICLMLCNADILFSVLVLHWVTTFDQASQNNNSGRTQPNGTAVGGSRLARTRRDSIDEIQLVNETSKLGVVESNVQGNCEEKGDLSVGTIVKAVMVTQESSPR